MKHAIIVTGGKQYRVAEGALPVRRSSSTRFWP